jgi:hypothetical protein
MRVTPAIRADLEAACEREGKQSGRRRSLAQEVQSRLDWSFQVDKERQHDSARRHIHALTEAIALVTERIETITKKKWQEDPFTSAAVRFGIERLLLTYGARGELKTPPNVKAATAEERTIFTVDGSAADVGTTQAAHVIAWIQSSPGPVRWGVVIPAEWESRWRLLRVLDPTRWQAVLEHSDKIRHS